MKRIPPVLSQTSFMFLVVLVCFASFCWDSIAAQLRNETPFILYDGLNYKNKPDLTAYGMSRIHIAYTGEIWGGAPSLDEPNEIAVKNLALKIDPNIPLVLDVEHWNVQGDGPEVQDNIDKLIQIVDWVHEINPIIKVGYFGLLPIGNPWRELNYVRVLNNPGAASAANYIAAYHELQNDDVRMRQLASHVDFVCPVIYTFYNLNGATYDKCWDRMAIDSIIEARQYGKPIYAFLWPQFYDVKDPNGDNTFIPKKFWRHELDVIRGHVGNGVIIWGSTTFRKSGWNANDPWWKATLDFIAGLT